jgi:hypothetical protein
MVGAAKIERRQPERPFLALMGNSLAEKFLVSFDKRANLVPVRLASLTSH